jgi:sugar porter (SP) family MFS transporter
MNTRSTNDGTNLNPAVYVTKVSLIVALGGFLMGFDASVVSGVIGFIQPEFGLSNLQVGWVVACLTLTATIGMLIAGPLSDRFGRRTMLTVAALVFLISAVASAFAGDYHQLVAARMIGGFGVGIALLIAPMYIGEISPPQYRGRMVSLNQFNIVLGISVAFFTNYLILAFSESDASWVTSLGLAENQWRWMLGLEALPAVLYLLLLRFVPESPRWLTLQQRNNEARAVLAQFTSPDEIDQELAAVHESEQVAQPNLLTRLKELFQWRMRLVLGLGISIAVLQQITGINAVFFYAPMIFSQVGFATDAAFMQAVFVGVVNVIFTLLAIAVIDKLGRKFLLVVGVGGIFICMSLLSWQFGQAYYQLDKQGLAALEISQDQDRASSLVGMRFDSDVEFKQALKESFGSEKALAIENDAVAQAINMNKTIVLVGILGFVAFFAMSLGPVMWVLFSEIFTNQVRGVAISFVGLINSGISFLVQLIFPWELANFGASLTFAGFAAFALIGWLIIVFFLPETKGKPLEKLSESLLR